jgi:hypothetical protein
MNVTVDWNGNQPRQLSQRVTVIKDDELKPLCAIAKNDSKGKLTDCRMNVRINSYQPLSVVTTVQYIEDELEIFEGTTLSLTDPYSCL